MLADGRRNWWVKRRLTFAETGEANSDWQLLKMERRMLTDGDHTSPTFWHFSAMLWQCISSTVLRLSIEITLVCTSMLTSWNIKNVSFSTENKLPGQARKPRSKDDQTSTKDNQNIANEANDMNLSRGGLNNHSPWEPGASGRLKPFTPHKLIVNCQLQSL